MYCSDKLNPTKGLFIWGKVIPVREKNWTSQIIVFCSYGETLSNLPETSVFLKTNVMVFSRGMCLKLRNYSKH